jgi:hypothetical protein
VDSVSYYICNKKIGEKKKLRHLGSKKVAAIDVLPQLFLASKKTSKDVAQTLQLFAELRARIIFFSKIDVFTNTPLPSSVFIRLL